MTKRKVVIKDTHWLLNFIESTKSRYLNAYPANGEVIDAFNQAAIWLTYAEDKICAQRELLKQESGFNEEED